MTNGILAHGDGLAMSVSSSSISALDQVDFQNRAFTPYAVLDPGSGRAYETFVTPPGGWVPIPEASFWRAEEQCRDADVFAANFRLRIGSKESVTLLFVRKEQRVRLLNRLCPGIEIEDDEYVAQCVSTRHTSVTEIWRLSDLFWRVASSGVGFRDFPAYLQKQFCLGRPTAWTFAWALVRGAYLNEHNRNDSLIGNAESLVRPDRSGKAKPREEAYAAFEERLRHEVELLKWKELS